MLLKQKMLIDAGWSRKVLLITVVRDRKGEAHAVLTVKTNLGDFILDSVEDEILLWNKTGYRFVMRQSQFDQKVWLSIESPVVTGSVKK